MPSRTLLEYLTEPNPTLDNRFSLPGLPTRHVSDEQLEKKDWIDFTYENLMSCYGHILQMEFDRPFPEISPSLAALECRIFDEDSFEHLLSRSVVPVVNESLTKAWMKLFPNMDKVISMTRGGRARRPQDINDEDESAEPRSSRDPGNPKIYPDWAGVQSCEGPAVYKNVCPGETKLSTKWDSMSNVGRIGYFWPLAQVLSYCVDNWNTRYGYLITQEELVVLRYSRERIGPGLAQTRSPRQPPAAPAGGHDRNTSIASLTSATSRMSIDQVPGLSRENSGSQGAAQQSSSFQASSSGGEIRPVEMKRIPWTYDGRKERLTVKLALWWIHMLAAAPGCDIVIGDDYPHLNTWVAEQGYFQHLSTGLKSQTKPTSGRVVTRRAPQGPSTPPRNQQAGRTGSSPLSSPLSVLSSPRGATVAMPSVEDIQTIQWDGNRNQFRFQTDAGRPGHVPSGTAFWNRQRSARFRPERDAGGRVRWVPVDRSSDESDDEMDESSSDELPAVPAGNHGKQRRR
ncbi:hypothetical protein PRK78_005787 [Emydomyces testavorans]|uniref:Uncharacterized protein n=1 Tax=Emydomyces testavorans TaxID=2070801 RepID=A0AAF0DKF3_9EURO|nr:hypothetical protein PRK78_005787 [Emydomyces testavorans]